LTASAERPEADAVPVTDDGNTGAPERPYLSRERHARLLTLVQRD
jgi:hypothetical protein